MPSETSQSKLPFHIRAFDLHLVDPTAGYKLSLQDNEKRCRFAEVLNDSHAGLRAMCAIFNHHGYLSENYRRLLDSDPAKVKFEATPIFYAPKMISGVIQILMGPGDRIGSLDKETLISYFGPTLSTFLLQQETPAKMLTLLNERPKDCMSIFGFVLPKHVQWADPAAKKKSR